MVEASRPTGRTVAVVGGGFAGALLALKLAAAGPGLRVRLIERGRRLGRGVAYGACDGQHLLNVPVSRMELGLTPTFADWLRARADDRITGALEESGGDLMAAFVPRELFGAYLEERIGEALVTDDRPGVSAVRGEAVGLTRAPRPAVRLADGRIIEADQIVLATGNMPPQAPGGPDPWLFDSPYYAPDPWAADAFDGLDPDAPVLLLGAGLTTVDIVLQLAGAGHRGPMLALSRRGIRPTHHKAGGAWPAFLETALPASPLTLTRLIRREVAAAEAAGVPWQRVFDAARPAVAAVWRGWTERQKRQFMRHLRPRWDAHRHRMAPRISRALDALVESGQLKMEAGRVRAWRRIPDGGRDRIEALYSGRDGELRRFAAARVINCTGPQRDLARSGLPLLAELRDRGLALPDALGLGLETEDSALLDDTRRASGRIFALGALTCPSWWEITAVPEITVQVERLVRRLANDTDGVEHGPLAAEDFMDLGAGI